MHIVVINPNSTRSMTDGILATARAAAPEDTTLAAFTNADGPPAIQGASDGAAAVPGVLELVDHAIETGAAAVIIACFDDTGLAEARQRARVPVIGIGQAAFLAASVFGRFTVITTLDVSVPVIEGNLVAYRFDRSAAVVRASGLPVLALERDQGHAKSVLKASARAVSIEDEADALVLGCAGMAPFGQAMQDASGLPAIDGVAAAVGLARTILCATPRSIPSE